MFSIFKPDIVLLLRYIWNDIAAAHTNSKVYPSLYLNVCIINKNSYVIKESVHQVTPSTNAHSDYQSWNIISLSNILEKHQIFDFMMCLERR